MAETVRRAHDARAQARREHVHTAEVAEAVAATQDRVAALMDQLAESRPSGAERLRALGAQARLRAEQERQRAASSPRGTSRGAAAAGSVLARWAAGSFPAGDAPAPDMVTALCELFDGCTDGSMLADHHGVIIWASRRLAEMFGYQPGELAGRPVEVLVPHALRAAHRRYRSVYQRHPKRWLSEDRAPLAGLRKDGTIISVGISLSPVDLTSGPLTLALVGAAPITPLAEDFAGIDIAASGHSFCRDELALLDRVVSSLFEAGLRLQVSSGSSGPVAQECVADAVLDILDGVIQDIRNHVFGAHGGGVGHTG